MEAARRLADGIVPVALTRRRSRLTVSTIHRAKGLEFDHVILLSPEDWYGDRDSEFGRAPLRSDHPSASPTVHRSATARATATGKTSDRTERAFKTGFRGKGTTGFEIRGTDWRGPRPPGIDEDPAAAQACLEQLAEADIPVPVEVRFNAYESTLSRPRYDAYFDGVCIGTLGEGFTRDFLRQVGRVKGGWPNIDWDLLHRRGNRGRSPASRAGRTQRPLAQPPHRRSGHPRLEKIMSDIEAFYAARAFMVQALKDELIGSDRDDVLTETPMNRFVAGILYPQQASHGAPAGDERTLGARSRTAKPGQRRRGLRHVRSRRHAGLAEPRPVSVGFRSLVQRCEPTSTDLTVTVSAAQYQDKDGKWHRVPLDDPPRHVSVASPGVQRPISIAPTLELHVVVREPRDGAKPVTLALVNTALAPAQGLRDGHAWYQVGLNGVVRGRFPRSPEPHLVQLGGRGRGQ